MTLPFRGGTQSMGSKRWSGKAKMIDHSLLNPTLTMANLECGIAMAPGV